jgi:excisionase family DNA binding protein
MELADANGELQSTDTGGGSGMVRSGEPTRRLTMSVEEAAEALGISRALAYEAIQRGQLSFVRIGRRVLIPKAALERLLEAAGGV